MFEIIKTFSNSERKTKICLACKNSIHQNIIKHMNDNMPQDDV